MSDQRRLAAILVADVVGSSKLMGSDEAGTLAQLKALRTKIIEPQIAEHAGRLFKSVGDGFLIEFASAVQAVSCAKAIQEANGQGRLPLRIGIHVGDVVVQGDDLMGDGVNVAARVEGIAEPGGIAITRAVHEQVRDKLALGFLDKGEIELKNIQRPVQVFEIGGTKVDGQAAALPLPDKPSIAVLPFQNMSGDPEQEYFADGVVEDIITALSRFHELFVIARNSSFAYRGITKDLQLVARALGVRYVVEGSLRKSGNRIRISVQLIDASSGAHLWADRYDRELADIFSVQDEVTQGIVGRLIAHVDKAEVRRAQQKPPQMLEAYDLYLRGRAQGYTHVGAPSPGEILARRRKLYEQALARDPSYAPAWAALSQLHVSIWLEPAHYEPLNTEYHSLATLDRAEALAQKAVLLDPELPAAHAALAWVLHWKKQPHDALAFFRRAVELNPNVCPYGYGLALAYAQRAEEAVAETERAMRLDPFHSPALFSHLGTARYMLGQSEAAVEALRTCVRRAPNFRPAFLYLAAASAQAGRIDEARAAAAEVMRIEPGFSLSTWLARAPYIDRKDAEPFAEDLRKAGLPE